MKPFSPSRRRHRYLRVPLSAAIVLGLCAAAAFWRAQRTQACGPFFSDAIFVFSKHPDFPLDKFAGGNFGVVNPTWARSYLVVAYRGLSGEPLNDSEARAIKSLWDDRLNNTYDYSDESWIKKWNEARKAAGAATPVQINVYRNREKPHEYESFLNCQQDAFVNAENILNDRVKSFGANSPEVQSWLAAQDEVFANCGEGKHMPKDVASETNLPAQLRADRAYQIAAANFYSTNYDEAKHQFEAIARNKDSAYRIIAPYMAARAVLRKGSLADKEDEGRPFIVEAETRLGSILKDDSLKESHHAAGRLLNLARLRAHPEDKMHELARTIMKQDSSDSFKQNVWDYTILMDRYLGVEDEEAKKQLPPSLGSDDMTDWIMTFEGDLKTGGAAHAIEKWQKTKSLPWLVAALTNADGKQAKLDDLLAGAANVSHSSPAYPTVAYHSVRLLKEANRAAEARAMLDKILASERQILNASALNTFLGERMLSAQNLDEFLQNAPRVPAGYSDDNDGREIPEEPGEAEKTAKDAKTLFDLDAATTFNKAMPVAIMKDAARSKMLPPNLKRDVAQAAFVRAAMLDDRESANQAAAVLEAELPQVKEFLAAYQKAVTPEARRFAAAFLTLKFPGLRPFVSAGVGRSTAANEVDSYRDNYWCQAPPAPFGGQPADDEQSKEKSFPVPDFLKASQTIATRQYAALQALGTGPNYLCRIAIEWAQKNPSDPRAPEALHLAVRSTRYGCTDKDTGRWSKAAYDLLHSRYPNTTWAKNTKYWFK